jgi:hypothetical protein
LFFDLTVCFEVVFIKFTLFFSLFQNSNGNGDFLSLNLVGEGHVQVRYDLGSGPANLTTSERITPGEWHVVKISRKGVSQNFKFCLNGRLK